MSRWFRMYDCLLDDPKVQRLPERFFKVWVNVLCVASRNDGMLPPIPDLAFLLRMSADDTESAIATLEHAGLIDRAQDIVTPHNWDARQYKSDTSTERVKRFRERSTKQPETVSVTPPDTEADTETEKKEDSPKRVRTAYPEDFEKFWDACSSWRGHSGKKEAADEWRKLSSEDRSAAMSGVGGYSASLKVPNAPTPLHVCRFLKYRRFEVYAGSVRPFSTPPPKPQYTEAELRERAIDFDRRYKAGEFG